jgi:hypothetical protein
MSSSYLNLTSFKTLPKSQILRVGAFLKDIMAFLDKMVIAFGSQFFTGFQMSIRTSGFPKI